MMDIWQWFNLFFSCQNGWFSARIFEHELFEVDSLASHFLPVLKLGIRESSSSGSWYFSIQYLLTSQFPQHRSPQAATAVTKCQGFGFVVRNLFSPSHIHIMVHPHVPHPEKVNSHAPLLGPPWSSVLCLWVNFRIPKLPESSDLPLQPCVGSAWTVFRGGSEAKLGRGLRHDQLPELWESIADYLSIQHRARQNERFRIM